ncbi:hypothetical protein AVEN_188710-1 [Araneus ventricosus]|uniref:Uncharacterized protein n=1 Tax=Araneus ventricosus TaxID=182803 RepID=A0A4Y2DAG1_ARAVE|nr:hypothetical protein AVEN_188710-1 [Araneus ventricosus]
MIYVRETDLQTMCLNVIVHHIQYLSKPNKSTEVYVEFLRRCYSDRLYNLLKKKCLFPEQYIEWILTPYWKNVSLPTCIDYPMNNIISKLQVMGHRYREDSSTFEIPYFIAKVRGPDVATVCHLILTPVKLSSQP